MKLDLFNNLNNTTKKSNAIQGFIKELGEFLEKNFSKNSLTNNERNQTSLLQKIQDERKITTTYRDKMHIERNNILDNYAQKTSNKGTMYYIYSKNSRKDNVYNLYICGQGKSHDIIELEESKLPKEAGVDSIIRIENGNYTLDKEATEEVLRETNKMINELLEEQTQKLNEYRIEGHLYEIVEKSSDRILLIDRTKDDGNCFEEIDFSSENLDKAIKGAIFKYANEEYRLMNIGDVK